MNTRILNQILCLIGIDVRCAPLHTHCAVLLSRKNDQTNFLSGRNNSSVCSVESPGFSNSYLQNYLEEKSNNDIFVSSWRFFTFCLYKKVFTKFISNRLFQIKASDMFLLQDGLFDSDHHYLYLVRYNKNYSNSPHF